MKTFIILAVLGALAGGGYYFYSLYPTIPTANMETSSDSHQHSSADSHENLSTNQSEELALAAAKPGEVVVYKSPTCGCCGKWVEHLQSEGFKVSTQDVQNVDAYKKKFGVPSQLSSCHTAVVDGYVIEGHVPAEDIKRLLKEKLPIIGLAVPEMPVGSPGMEMGDRKDPYDVMAFSKDSTQTVFSSH